MFSLVKFDNDGDFYVVKTKDVKHHNSDNCIVKYKGCSYSAIFIKADDNKENLEEKKQSENLMGTINAENQETQIAPRIPASRGRAYQNISPSTMLYMKEYIKNLPPLGSNRSDKEPMSSVTIHGENNASDSEENNTTDFSSFETISRVQFDLSRLFKFSLITYDDSEFCVVNSKSITQIQGGTCVVKCKGGKYASKLISTSDTSCGKTKKCRWTIDEQEALTAEFGDISSMEKLPSLKECMRVVSENEVLCCRTPAQVKTFIDNKRKKGKKIKQSLQQ
ncbi:uncharacterized protein LOC133334260 isoform X3 [Musca vetustissima]|uniref:uncharacterized protein LOC133334260 isoform X3 n=1 Tax=Musca vetustissima TaxID=27455 RepID=UPI002AB6467D|nr:uncharacterized protein LOC133334260 isoform X3 [Musca vetustissima]XP_061398536.1 uncharacterized protein LOC133334260 isoform X3 [Musca vetustissima]